MNDGYHAGGNVKTKTVSDLKFWVKVKASIWILIPFLETDMAYPHILLC
jgi:hypothetical protein